jgi:hypothetical protein
VCFYVFTSLFIEVRETLEASKNPRNRKINHKASFHNRVSHHLFSSACVRSILGLLCSSASLHSIVAYVHLITVAIDPSFSTREHKATLVPCLGARALVHLNLSEVRSIALPAFPIL